jgi:hypothetical protein
MEVQTASELKQRSHLELGDPLDSGRGKLAGEGGGAFNLEKYLRASGATRPEAFDWRNPAPRLDDEALFCLGCMMDIEAHTIVYLREFLGTSVIQDPSITAFLTCWNYEEFFHSQVLKKFLLSQDVTVDDRHFATLRQQGAVHHITRAGSLLLSRMTRHFPAVQMTWGAINEMMGIESYSALAERTQHPLLEAILHQIVKDERRHFSFYFNQAKARLRPRAAQALTTIIIKWLWRPVGNSVRGDEATQRMRNYLYPDEFARQRLCLVKSGYGLLRWKNPKMIAIERDGVAYRISTAGPRSPAQFAPAGPIAQSKNPRRPFRMVATGYRKGSEYAQG